MDAAAHLVQSALLEIRMMTARGEVFHADELVDEDSAADTEVTARTHLLAEICHQFIPCLLERHRTRGEAMAASALSARWRVVVPEGRRWMASRLAQLGPEYEQLLDPPTRADR